MKQKKNYYITAQLTGRFSAVRRDKKSSRKTAMSEVQDLLNVELSNMRRIEGYHHRYLVVGGSYIHFNTLYGAAVKQGSTFYRANLQDVYINDIRISEYGKDGSYVFGKLEGKLTATIEQPAEETVVEEVLIYEQSGEQHQISFINNTSGELVPIDSIHRKANGESTKQSKSPNVTRNHKYITGGDVVGWLFGAAIVLALFVALHKVLLPLLAVVTGITLLYYLVGLLKNFFAYLFAGLLLIGLVSWLFSLSYSAGSRQEVVKDEVAETTEIKKTEKTDAPLDPILVVHHRMWKDYNGNQYEGDLKIRQSQYFLSKQFHSSLSEQNFTEENSFWNFLYQQLSAFDSSHLGYVYEMFDSIGKAQNLNQVDFAQMIVSCIQDIPYTLVAGTDCETYMLEHPQDVAIIEQSACFGPVKYGVQSPNEFIYNLKGDCDTRTLLCYTVLRHFNYDVAILNSKAYRHSMLGVALPFSGDYKSYNGKPYFFWETTAPNCLPGFISPEFNNSAYWNFILVSK